MDIGAGAASRQRVGMPLALADAWSRMEITQAAFPPRVAASLF
jgi:hypothetical protein